MLRALILAMAGVLIGATASATVAPDHALYLAQRYAYAGLLAKAAAAAETARGVAPSCPVLVKLKTARAVIPLCAPDAIRPPASVRAQVSALLGRAAAAPPQLAATLLKEARALDPFDGRLVQPLANALRLLGREMDAKKLEAEAEALENGTMLLSSEAPHDLDRIKAR
jgi:hypothetical protein